MTSAEYYLGDPAEFVRLCKDLNREDILHILFKLIEQNDGTLHRENLTKEERYTLWVFLTEIERSR